VTYIEELQDAIKKLHNAEARHFESVPVKETHKGQTVWEGVVEVFELIGHPKASMIYAWAHERWAGPRLAIRTVESREAARRPKRTLRLLLKADRFKSYRQSFSCKPRIVVNGSSVRTLIQAGRQRIRPTAWTFISTLSLTFRRKLLGFFIPHWT
jgi:hypothetical protein